MAKRDLLKMPDDFEANMRALLATPPAPAGTAGSRKVKPKPRALTAPQARVALIAIAAIGVVTVFGRDIRELFSGTTDSLAGNQATNTAPKAKVSKTKSLKTFGSYSAATGDK